MLTSHSLMSAPLCALHAFLCKTATRKLRQHVVPVYQRTTVTAYHGEVSARRLLLTTETVRVDTTFAHVNVARRPNVSLTGTPRCMILQARRRRHAGIRLRRCRTYVRCRPLRVVSHSGTTPALLAIHPHIPHSLSRLPLLLSPSPRALPSCLASTFVVIHFSSPWLVGQILRRLMRGLPLWSLWSLEAFCGRKTTWLVEGISLVALWWLYA